LVLAAVGALVLEVPNYYRLTVRGIAAEGSIIELQPENHGSVLYEYQVDSRSFSGGGHAGDINTNFDELRIGQRVTVFYDAHNAAVSCLGAPQKHLNSLLRGTAFLAAFPTLAIFVFKIRQSIRNA
jgi:hypothetical protein